jgi:hypothetical protein
VKALRISIAAGLGLGLASAVQLFLIIALGPGRLTAALALAAGLGAAIPLSRWPEDRTTAEPRAGRALAIASGVILATAVVAFVLFAWNRPQGRWDGWMIWNLRARAILRAGPGWRDAFTDLMPWTHADYPLALPLSVEGLWALAGSESPLAPASVGLLYTLASVGVLAGAVASLRGPAAGLVAGIALLGADGFVRCGAAQYADVPLGFHVLVALASLALADAGGGRRWLAIAGAAAGLAAWTKNEGALYLVAIPLARAVTARGEARALPAEAGLFLAGASPSLAALAVFKATIAPTNDLLRAQGAGTLARLVDPSRWKSIVVAVARDLAQPPSVWLLVGAVALLGLAPGARRERPVRVGAIALALVALGLLLAYATTPYPLEWHLKTSLPRLLLQAWPSVILLAFLAARPPETLA